MFPKRNSFWLLFRTIVFSIVASIGVITYDETLTRFINIDPQFKFDSFTRSWIREPAKQLPGSYLVSVGRLPGACTLYVDSHVRESNGSASGKFRTELSIKSEVVVSKSQEFPKVELKCEDNVLRSNWYIHRPIVASYRDGQILSLLRVVLDSLLGPFLLALIIYSVTSGGINQFDKREKYTLILFSSVGILYSLSLSHFPRLFLETNEATLVHALLKVLFSFGLMSVLENFSNQRSLAKWFLILFALVLPIVYLIDAASTFKVYQFHIGVLLLSALELSFKIAKSGMSSTRHIVVFALTVFYVIANVWDAVILINAQGSFSSNAVLLIAAAVIWKLDRHIRQITFKRFTAATELSTILKDLNDPNAIFQTVAGSLWLHSGFRRVSAYIDSFAIGRAPEQYSKLLRVFEKKYGSKDTKKDIELDVASGQGLKMVRSMQANEVRLEFNEKDGSAYVIVPIGNIGTINLSDPGVRKIEDVYQSAEIVQGLFPLLSTLEKRFSEVATARSIRLDQLRVKYGVGRFEREFGVIFADAIGYTQNCERYPDFADFFSREYLPGLIRAVGSVAEVKDTFGDELFLVSLQELLPPSYTIEDATMKTIEAIVEYANGAGEEISLSRGYQPIQFRIGASIGVGELSISARFVELNGMAIIEAKRCSNRATPTEPFISSNLANRCLNKNKIVMLDEEIYPAKKQILVGRKVVFKNSA